MKIEIENNTKFIGFLNKNKHLSFRNGYKMLSILCNTNLGEEDCFRSSVKSYSNLAEEAHVKNLNDNKDLFSGIVSELISVLKETTDASLTFDRVKKTIGDENKLDYVSVAISCLQLFAQVNWLGPVPIDLLDLPPALQQNKDLSLDNHVFNLVDYFPLKSQVIKTINFNIFIYFIY